MLVLGGENKDWGIKMQRIGNPGKIKIASNAQVCERNVRKRLKTFEKQHETFEK